MIINTDLLELQCRLLQNDSLEDEVFQHMMAHPAMEAFLEHEEMLSRKTTKDSIRKAFAEVIAGEKDTSSLMLDKAKASAEKLRNAAKEIQRDQQCYVNSAVERIHRFTDSRIGGNTAVYLYALGKDGGFSPCEGELYINLLTNQDGWMNILCHEMYHARELNAACEERRIGYLNLTEESDFRGDMLLSELAEEGIATLIQYDGHVKVERQSVITDIRQLQGWEKLEIKERKQLYCNLSAGSQRYAVAGYLANKVLLKYGFQGLEQWSSCGRLDLFYEILKDE